MPCSWFLFTAAKTKDPKLLPGYCCVMSDYAFVWKSVDFRPLDWENHGMVQWSLIGYPSRNTDELVVERDLNCADLA